MLLMFIIEMFFGMLWLVLCSVWMSLKVILLLLMNMVVIFGIVVIVCFVWYFDLGV